MIIVFDTCELQQNYYLESAHFKLVCDYLLQGHKVYVPSVVHQELLYHHKRDLEKYANDILKANKNASSRMLVETPGNLTSLAILLPDFVERETEKYLDFWNGLLDFQNDSGWQLALTPEIPQNEIVSRILAKKKPFSKGDAGYKDFLIWQTILDITKKTNEVVCFVSSNISDFSNQGFGLHPDLLQDLYACNLQKSSIIYFRSTNEFVHEIVQSSFTDITTGHTLLKNQLDMPSSATEEKLKSTMEDAFWGWDIWLPNPVEEYGVVDNVLFNKLMGIQKAVLLSDNTYYYEIQLCSVCDMMLYVENDAEFQAMKIPISLLKRQKQHIEPSGNIGTELIFSLSINSQVSLTYDSITKQIMRLGIDNILNTEFYG